MWSFHRSYHIVSVDILYRTDDILRIPEDPNTMSRYALFKMIFLDTSASTEVGQMLIARHKLGRSVLCFVQDLSFDIMNARVTLCFLRLLQFRI